MALTNAHGMIGKSFQMGIGPESVMFLFDKDGDKSLHIDRPLDMDAAPVRTKFSATEVYDVVNLGLVNELQRELYEKAIDYANRRIMEMMGTGDGPSTPGNLMLEPVVLTELTDGAKISLGTLKKSKFLSQVAVEITEPFYREDGSRYQVAIGTAEEPEAYLPYFELTSGGRSKLNDVIKTLVDDEEIILSVREFTAAPKPGSFNYKVFNLHSNVKSDITMDPTGKVVFISLSCPDPGNEDIADTTRYPNLSEKNLLDFSFNIPAVVGHTYIITETNNPALRYEEDRKTVTSVDGIWEATNSVFTATSTEEVVYFLLEKAESNSEYVHFLVYDKDCETPDVPVLAYHVRNGIGVSEDSSVIPGTVPVASYDTPGIVMVDPETMTVDASGKLSLPLATVEDLRALRKEAKEE